MNQRPGSPIWARNPDASFKSLGEMTAAEREQARFLSAARVFIGRGKCVKDVQAFIHRMEFKASERLANGQDSDFTE